MRYKTIACLDDLLCDAGWWTREYFYDLLRAPIQFAAGLDIAKSPRLHQRHNLALGFDVDVFRALCGLPSQTWLSRYHAIPREAQVHLARHLPPDTLFLGFEMPPWLRATLDAAQAPWLDIRLAPLRFGSDLWVALASNDAALRTALSPHALSDAQVLAEACLMAARVRHRTRGRADAVALDGHVVYVGQTEDDAALLDDRGRCVRVQDHADALREWVGPSPVLYKPHPQGGAFSDRERRTLEQLLGRPVAACAVDTYDLLAGDDDLRFVALSSGVVQEAVWFGKPSAALFRPLCTPAFGASASASEHLLVAPHDFLSEPLWAALLGLPTRDGAMRLPPVPNRLREGLDTWWGYDAHLLRDNAFFAEAFRQHGRALPSPAAPPAPAGDGLALEVARQRIDALCHEVEGLKEALRVVLRQSTHRVDMAWSPGPEAADA